MGWHLCVTGEKLVWQQEDPVQEEHREGPGGSQHVRCEGSTGRSSQPWRIPRSYDVPWFAVGWVLVQRGVPMAAFSAVYPVNCTKIAPPIKLHKIGGNICKLCSKQEKLGYLVAEYVLL